MALASRLNGTPTQAPRKTKCAVLEFAATLPDEDSAALLEATKNPAWQLTQLVRTVRDEYPDQPIPHYSTFQRHRNGNCACVGA